MSGRSNGGQYAAMAPLFEHYGIQLWTPEVGGRVDAGAEDHEQTMLAMTKNSATICPWPATSAAACSRCRAREVTGS